MVATVMLRNTLGRRGVLRLTMPFKAVEEIDSSLVIGFYLGT